MRKPEVVASVRRGLLRQGFGRDYATRAERELEEHWLDLVAEGVRQGLDRAEAEARATASLGNTGSLVKEFTVRMQRSSWLGRHPIPGFAALALVATIGWWAIFALSGGTASGLVTWSQKKGGATLISPGFFFASVDWIRWTSYVVVPWFICYVARRFHCGWKAALWGCVVVALHNTGHNFAVSGVPGNGTMSWSYSYHLGLGLAWLPLLTPPVVWAIDLAWNARPEPRQYEQTDSISTDQAA